MSNVKLRAKIILGFAIVIIMSAAMGGLGIYSLNNTDTTYSNALDDADMAATDITYAYGRLQLSRSLLRDYIYEESANRAEHKKELTEMMDSVLKYIAEAKEYTVEKNKGLLEDWLSSTDEFYTYMKNTMELVDENKLEDARKSLLEEEETLASANREQTAIALKAQTDSATEMNKQGSASVSRTSMIIVVVLVAMIVISILVAIFISGAVTKPIDAICYIADKVAGGDYTESLDSKYLQAGDETGALSRAFNKLVDSIKSTFNTVNTASGQLMDASLSSEESFTSLSGVIQDISAATEELSAGMEETAASAQEMNATAVEIDNAVEVVSNKSQDGARLAGDISERANNLKRTFVQSKSNADSTFERIQGSLLKSLEDAKAVEEINVLADAILSITSQTNLLALNAAIEAARAGEQGKGFAVVADEIRTLAENSQETVTKIQEVANVVVQSVNVLVGDSNKLLDFVSKDVMKDYDSMLEATDDYDGDAKSIDDMTTDISAASEELQASIQAMLSTIEEVARAANEGATTTTSIAEQMNEITGNAQVVMSNVEAVKGCADGVEEMMKQFKL